MWNCNCAAPVQSWKVLRSKSTVGIQQDGSTNRDCVGAARIGDGWTSFEAAFLRDEPVYRATLAESGRDRAAMTASVAFDDGKDARLADSPWVTDPAGTAALWSERGADGAIVTAWTVEDVDALVDAVARW